MSQLFPNIIDESSIWWHQIIKNVRIAEESENQFMVSASIYDSSKRHISSGINNPTKSHPTQARYASMSGNVDKIFLHAEISALIKSIKTKKDPHTIVVVRVKKDGSFGTSKPCPVCQLAIEETSIKNVIYYDGYNFVMETRK